MTAAGSPGANVSIALLHHPVYDKNRQVVTTAVTNLDIHDIARSARTYGLHRYYVVTPVVEQQALAARIRQHWLEGWGATYNPKRRAALELLRVTADLETACNELTNEFGRPVKVVMTGARGRPDSVSFAVLAELLRDPGQPYLLAFGTGWGLTEEVFGRADLVLEPVRGPGEYNHLSVRSAAAIILDRLLGVRSGE
jgi:hypothetical protein